MSRNNLVAAGMGEAAGQVPVATGTGTFNWGSGSGGPHITQYFRPGILAVETGVARLKFPVAVVIQSVTATVNTAPTGVAIIVDVLKNGTTIFTTQGNRPTIAALGNVSSAAVPDVTIVFIGDYLTVNVAQVGTTATGSDLTVSILAQ